MRSIGLDVGKHVAEVAIREPGRPTRSGGRISASPESLQAFAATLGPDDQVVLEATTNTWAIVELVDLTLRLLDGLAAEVELADGGIARAVVDDARVRHLLTIPGVGLQTAVGLSPSSATSGASPARTSSLAMAASLAARD